MMENRPEFVYPHTARVGPFLRPKEENTVFCALLHKLPTISRESLTLNAQNATICTRKGKDDEIKLFHGRRGRHLCGKRLEVFVCVRMVSAEASAQEMTALHHSIKKSTKRKAVVSIAIKEYSMSRDSTRQLSPNFKVREFARQGDPEADCRQECQSIEHVPFRSADAYAAQL